ncbi:MAG: GTP-binding protein [Conexivisphaerales archaeon]
MIGRAVSGDRKALARIMTEIELGNEKISESLIGMLRGSSIVGITGFPGTGKSTIISRLAMEMIKRGQKVGVLCIDPSSPFSGGSVLGDRVRMSELGRQSGSFIRSVPTSGKNGGLGYFTVDLANALDVAGYSTIFIETVGAGQDEIEIHNIADVVVMVTVPNLGDEIQAIKAGIMEVADIFVVNKADIGPADEKVMELTCP